LIHVPYLYVTDDLVFVFDVPTQFTKLLLKLEQSLEIYLAFWTMKDALDANRTRIIILDYCNAILRPKYSDNISTTAHTT